MAEKFLSLTVYRLRDTIKGQRVANLDQFIDPHKKSTVHALVAKFAFEARLYVSPQDTGLPPWVQPLEVGFGKLREIAPSVSNSAVLIIRVHKGKRDFHFALTFGAGRFLLLPEHMRRRYGFRVALNAIYRTASRSKKLDLTPLRSVDSKTVADNVIRTRRQVDRKAPFESFEVDIDRDQLTGLTGVPADSKNWGARIDGSDSLHFGRALSFDQLGTMCLQLEQNSKKLPQVFEWVDNFRAVRSTATKGELWSRLLNMVKDGDDHNLELAPPELVEWGDIAYFAFSSDPTNTLTEPTIAHYRKILRDKQKLQKLTLGQLKSGRLLAFNANKEEIHEWPMFRCLSGEIVLRNRKERYILSEGEFFEVAREFLDQLNRDIDKIPSFEGYLPTSGPRWSEDRYNKAAAADPNKLLLDKRTVKVTSRTTPIEICDLLSVGKALIHVKRKLNSSSLSHLFSQGLVSADLLLTSEEFRTKTHDRIRAACSSAKKTNRFFALIPANAGISPSEFTVVYGIIAPWKSRSLSEALPFFSKVNLRHYAHALRRMGYNVACSQIQVAAGGKHGVVLARPPKKRPTSVRHVAGIRKGNVEKQTRVAGRRRP